MKAKKKPVKCPKGTHHYVVVRTDRKCLVCTRCGKEKPVRCKGRHSYVVVRTGKRKRLVCTRCGKVQR